MLLESQISPKPLAKRLILNFFLQSFLSLDVYDRAPRRDQRSLKAYVTASFREWAQCIAVLKALQSLNRK